MQTSFLCVECTSPHFVLKLGADMWWLACCEGCGAVYALVQGSAQMVLKGGQSA